MCGRLVPIVGESEEDYIPRNAAKGCSHPHINARAVVLILGARKLALPLEHLQQIVNTTGHAAKDETLERNRVTAADREHQCVKDVYWDVVDPIHLARLEEEWVIEVKSIHPAHEDGAGRAARSRNGRAGRIN